MGRWSVRAARRRTWASGGPARSGTAAAAAVLLLFVAQSAEAAAPPPGPVASTVAQPGPVKAGGSRIIDFSPALTASDSPTRMVFIQLSGPGAAEVYDQVHTAGGPVLAATRAARARRASIRQSAADVLAALTALDPATQELFEVGNAVPGLAVAAGAAALRMIADRSGVESISALVPKSTAASPEPARRTTVEAAAAQFLAGRDTGRGVTVGIIDTGIDYTHADFGGSGTAAAFRTAYGALTFTPTAKVVGGYDFVGDGYDAGAGPAAGTADPRIPHPDGNPLDCQGHGTEVAGAVAGYGVSAAGLPVLGETPAAAEQLQMTVPSGSAPGASLYALKVFGCAGTSDAVIPALDWSLDPNGDGNFADRLDVVDLSLSSPSAVADDPDAVVLDRLALLGVLPVVAAGNAGDSTEAMGSPGPTTRAITVAGSIGQFRRLDGLRVTLPSGEALTAAGQVSVSYSWSSTAPVTGLVVGLADDPDGCSALSPRDAATVAGKIAWLSWDDTDATRSCGSAVRAANVYAAGAIGAVLTSSAPVFEAGITGDPAIPVFQLTPAATAALDQSVGQGLSVTFDPSLIGATNIDDPNVQDLLAADSARGTHGAPFVVKPDLAAPASERPVARSGSGSSAQWGTGTSLAAAVVAGAAAGVIQAHPQWSAEQVKAALMNTATHDVTSGPRQSGQVFGPARVGAGRVDPESAARASVLAYSATTSGAVSVSFGVVEADVTQESIVTTQSVVVQNTGPERAELGLSYRSVVSQAGVTLTVSPATATLDPGAGLLATVTMTIDPSALRRSIDPTTAVQQTNAVTGLDEPRNFVPDASGVLVIEGSGAAAIRVPVYGAATPVSTTVAANGSVQGAAAVVLTGQGFNQKSDPDPESTRYASLTSVLALGYASSVPACALPTSNGCRDAPGTAEGKILAVGAGRSGPDEDAALGRFWFGLSGYGNFRSLGTGFLPTVAIDTNGDRTADFLVQVRSVGGRSDLLYAYLFRGSGVDATLVSIAPVNFNNGAVDTNVFDNSVLLIPVDPQLLGLTAGATSFPIGYSISTYSPGESLTRDSTVDSTGWIGYDLADPAVSTASPLWADQGDTGIPYRLGSGRVVRMPGDRIAPAVTTALVLHLHGATGAHQDIFPLPGR